MSARSPSRCWLGAQEDGGSGVPAMQQTHVSRYAELQKGLALGRVAPNGVWRGSVRGHKRSLLRSRCRPSGVSLLGGRGRRRGQTGR